MKEIENNVMEILWEFSKFVIEQYDSYKKAIPKRHCKEATREGWAKQLTIEQKKFAKQILKALPTLDRETLFEEYSKWLKENNIHPYSAEAKNFEDFLHEVLKMIIPEQRTLDRDKVNSYIVRLVNNYNKYFDNEEDKKQYQYQKRQKAVDQICSLIPAGEVVATGKPKCYSNSADGDVVKVGELDLWDYFCEKDKPGTLIWVPDKEVKNAI